MYPSGHMEAAAEVRDSFSSQCLNALRALDLELARRQAKAPKLRGEANTHYQTQSICSEAGETRGIWVSSLNQPTLPKYSQPRIVSHLQEMCDMKCANYNQ